jgi:Ca2+:H+ antiporter
LAKAMGIATEELALRTNQTVGGLLNATFGNAVEMIMSILALKQKLVQVVQSSLLGSILSNLLLVLGACFVCGGLKFKVQRFNLVGAQTSASILALSSMSLIIPAAFQATLKESKENAHQELLILSRGTAIVLLLVYLLYILFQLRTHREFFEDDLESKNDDDDDDGERGENEAHAHAQEEEEQESPSILMISAISLLLISTIFVAICAEYLVSSIEGVSQGLGLSEIFIGLIILPIVGNAAEHVSAITFAMKDKMSLSVGIAIGSSSQIALLVTPLMVIVGWIMDVGMTLDFHPFQTIICFVAIVMVNCKYINISKWAMGRYIILYLRSHSRWKVKLVRGSHADCHVYHHWNSFLSVQGGGAKHMICKYI